MVPVGHKPLVSGTDRVLADLRLVDRVDLAPGGETPAVFENVMRSVSAAEEWNCAPLDRPRTRACDDSLLSDTHIYDEKTACADMETTRDVLKLRRSCIRKHGEEASVSEICTATQISRRTFYN
ncbi:MAG: hypothetical protein ABSF00_02275 [Candidatus Bathyarchaeia archaeon]